MMKFILFIIGMNFMLAYGQIILNTEPEKKDPDRIQGPTLRPFNPAHFYYNEYNLSAIKERKLDDKIQLIYDYDQAQRCKKIGKITTPYRVLSNYVPDKTNCEIAIRTLMDHADKMGGDALYISIIADDCKLGRFQSFALKCN